MKKAAFLMIAGILLAICLPAFAQEFPDVPPDHWAYDAVQDLVDKGIIQGYPDGTFGGKRAMTRYEFAEALSKAIPAILEMVPTTPVPPVPGVTPPPPPPAAGPQITREEFDALRNLVNEFRDELAAMGVDVEALRRDIAALAERVIVIEEEIARVKLTGVGNMIARGGVQNSAVAAFDRDMRQIGGTPGKEDKLLANSSVFTDLMLGMTAKVGEDAALNVDLNVGDYTRFALVDPTLQDFILYNANLDAPVKLGPLGAARIVVGRFPFQLTPLTLKLVDPDSYTSVARFDDGNFVLDGGKAELNLGRVSLTAFAAKASTITDLLTPDLLLSGAASEVAQLGGARAVIGAGSIGNIGLTWYQAGLAVALGTANVTGADINTSIGSLGLAAEWAQTEPNDFPTTLGDNNTAWNAKLNWQMGNLALGAGFTTVEQNYCAPGYWSRTGAAVNLVNVSGPVANLSYALSPALSITAEGQFLEPDDNTVAVSGRTATIQSPTTISATGLDKITCWKAGIKYGLSAASSIDLGWEQVNWEPLAGNNTEERYITIGLGHDFSTGANLKLLYQIVEYDAGAINPYPVVPGRGGIATAQFQLKY